MENAKDFFICFFDNSKEFEKYLRLMKRDRTWGDELTLRAMCDYYRVTIHVLTSTPGFGGYYLKYGENESKNVFFT